MLDRRTHPRDRVIFGGTISPGAVSSGRMGTNVDCVVRNISQSGANVELPSFATVPEELRISIPKIGRTLLAKIVWWRANRAGLAFEAQDGNAKTASLEERLRISERKARALKQRVQELLRET